jgi:hypothetical protein
MYNIETKYFGNIKILDNRNDFYHLSVVKMNDKEDTINVYFNNTIGIINDENITNLTLIFNNYESMINKSLKYLVENYNNESEMRYYFEDLFANQFVGTFAAYLMIKSNNTQELNKLIQLPINEKIKYMPLPDINIYYFDKGYETRMIFDSVKDKYSTSFWLHYDIEMNLQSFWIVEINSWK